ncbi:MAG: chemotaxis response regulator protein-glutamate methylesterase [Sinimarinibacterium sp.]|jgi:two-component system chemotaxis response regulator CheB
MDRKIRVLVVDDSALMRRLLTEFLSADPQIEVVGAAPDPFVAREKIKQLAPDVLTLDVEMPRMDGLTFLENLMRLRPMPVVMVSSLTEHGAEITLQALELGAVDFVTKPKVDLEAGIRQYAEELVAKIKAASRARVRGINALSAPPKAPPPRKRVLRTTEKLIAIGASTGGTEAIKDVLLGMPADAPAIVIAQHIPAAFSGPFAARMDRTCAMRVGEAQDGQQIVPGHAYIAPGDWHLRVVRDGARYVCRLDQTAPVNRHRPSVDVLLRSVADNAGTNAVGAILTGMGEDGARGLLAMREAGCRTLAQDETTSVVWGMPGAAHKLGAAEQVLPLEKIAGQLLAWTA